MGSYPDIRALLEPLIAMLRYNRRWRLSFRC